MCCAVISSGVQSGLSVYACRYEVRHVSGVGQRSPPRGGVDPQAANQQLIVDDDNDDDLPASEAAGLPVTCITISTVAIMSVEAILCTEPGLQDGQHQQRI